MLNHEFAPKDPQEAMFSNPIEGTETAENLSPDEQRTAIKEIVTREFDGEEPDALFTHSGGIAWAPHSGRYKTLAFSILGEHGLATGSKTRVIGAAEVAEALPELPIITNSYNRFNPEEPTMASVARAELIARGVPGDRIEMEEASFSTITQMVEMVNMAVERGWTKVVAMTNEYHVPRMREMYNRLDTIIDDADFQKTLEEFKNVMVVLYL